MADKRQTILGSLASRPTIDYAAIRLEEEKRNARFARRIERLKCWAMNTDKEKLAEQYARHVLRGIAERGLINTQREAIERYSYSEGFHRTMSDLNRQDVERFAAEIFAIHADRRKGYAKKLANDKDGKQAAKKQALNLWQDWQAGRAQYKSGAAFARHVVDSLPIENEKTVQRWMKLWAAEIKNRD
jgi:hypothetical protein